MEGDGRGWFELLPVEGGEYSDDIVGTRRRLYNPSTRAGSANTVSTACIASN